MKLSVHFTLEELTESHTAERKGINNSAPPEIVLNLKMMLCPVLEAVRELFNAPLIIDSGYRSVALNRVIGGAATSAHVKGLAADIRVKGFTSLEVARRIGASGIQFDQLIMEGTWVHIGLSYETMRNECLIATFPSGRAVYQKTDRKFGDV